VLAVVVWSWVVICVYCVKFKSNSKLHTVHTAYDPAPHNHSQHNQCRTPYAVIHGLVLLMMGIMMPETFWDRSLIINIGLVASGWFISLHPTFHDARSQEPKTWSLLFIRYCCATWHTATVLRNTEDEVMFLTKLPTWSIFCYSYAVFPVTYTPLLVPGDTKNYVRPASQISFLQEGTESCDRVVSCPAVYSDVPEFKSRA